MVLSVHTETGDDTMPADCKGETIWHAERKFPHGFDVHLVACRSKETAMIVLPQQVFVSAP